MPTTMAISDLIQANGHVQDNAARIFPGVSYAQPTLLFENRGGRQLADVSSTPDQRSLCRLRSRAGNRGYQQ